jgi:mono/diheme cytochrome c family protein
VPRFRIPQRLRPPAVAACAALALALIAGGGAFAPSVAPAVSLDDPEFAPGLTFRRDVLPILNGSCIECHGPAKRGGRLRLDSRAAALAGGRAGPALAPGDVAKSLLIERVRGEGGEQRMPLDRDALPESQIRMLEAWIAAGAPWPADAGDDPAQAGDQHEAHHWAYVAPIAPPVPAVSGPHAAWARTTIDRFVLARLHLENLEPGPEAPPAVLLRRIHLDLIGLPPSVEEVLAFEADHSDAAYAAVVDRLLASPRFGEKWARHWLDLARYADSRGYEKDGAWSMWPYRDWVVSAFNADLPFDRFTIEQLAGDLLPDATLAQRIATGFNRCTMINEEGGTDPEEQRVNAVMDRTATTAAVWLGSTLGCAQCHDHKYDPFSQKEYYQFYSFFNHSPAETSQDARAEISITSYTIEVPPHDAAHHQARADLAKQMFDALPVDAVIERRAWGRELASHQARLKPATTQVMRDLDTPRPTRVLARGSFLSPGEAVTAGVPAVLGAMPDLADETLRRDRLALARWIASPANPLTARVAVNRLWAEVFGRGLVDTPEDFGTRGSPPSHPDLLDHLATELVSHGWSQKAIIRLIVTSSTYRQSSATSTLLRERDPDNRLLARGPRFRLEGELVRDTALAAAGLLTTRVGGPSVYPPQPPGVWSNPYVTEPYVESLGEDRYRRGIYTVWKRSSPYPTFVAFDATQRQVSCSRRPRTNTALQALTTLNDRAFVEAAAALALRTLRRPGLDDAARIERLWRTVLARAPESDEAARLLTLVTSQKARYAGTPADARNLLAALPGGPPQDVNPAEAAAWTLAASVVLNLDEALSKP